MAKLYGKRWQVISSEGEGGQAWVYRVTDTLESTGASTPGFVLKRLKNHARLNRFKREIEALHHLKHDGICPVVDYCLDDPAFVVMPFVDGQSLSSLRRQPPLESLQLFADLCEIVGSAHQESVVHRDLKPENIIVRRNGTVAVLDFELCYFLDDQERLTETMEQVGSRFYMAPELESGRAGNVTTKADVYSLGKILYHMLTGRHLARENLEGDNDLVHLTANLQLGYVTEQLLKPALSENPEARPEVVDLQQAVENVARLITEHYYPGIVGSLCRFCGDGHYERFGSHVKLDVWESANIARGDRFILVRCDKCGNVQWFATSQ